MFVLLLILLVFFALRKVQKAPSSAKARFLRYLLIAGGLVVLGYMGTAGWLGGLFAVLGLALAFLLRLLPSLLQNAPYLHQIWMAWQRSQQGQAQQQESRHTSGKMTAAEAYEVLGLKMGASDKEIIEAHRRLMQKIHPDRGGSDYLAAKINLAKKTLLER
ncbi:DnaJ domain-containing protein [Methylomicrobium lacus]|uniref:DnaJ domain-containing protein n=1 Tax=Methylomicrobium lacus TaxID=136992 RepID=UPI0035A92A39